MRHGQSRQPTHADEEELQALQARIREELRPADLVRRTDEAWLEARLSEWREAPLESSPRTESEILFEYQVHLASIRAASARAQQDRFSSRLQDAQRLIEHQRAEFSLRLQDAQRQLEEQQSHLAARLQDAQRQLEEQHWREDSQRQFEEQQAQRAATQEDAPWQMEELEEHQARWVSRHEDTQPQPEEQVCEQLPAAVFPGGRCVAQPRVRQEEGPSQALPIPTAASSEARASNSSPTPSSATSEDPDFQLAQALSASLAAQSVGTCTTASSPRNGDIAAKTKEGFHAGRNNDTMCVICLDEPRTHAFVPCYHRCVCEKCCRQVCAGASASCPICRVDIAQAVRIFG